MFRKLYTLLLITTLLTFVRAGATHIYGGELLYTYETGNTYTIKLVLYGDCGGLNFPHLAGATPTINIYNGNVFYRSLMIPEDSALRVEVSPVCDKDKDKTKCVDRVAGTLPGVTRFIYDMQTTLPPAANWRIVFAGEMNNGTQAGRSTDITNITTGQGGGQLMYLVATLNNANGHNSSPQYTSIPTPFYCINREQHYNQGAVDPNGDSLAFTLINALSGGAATQYIAPYTGASPLQTAQGRFSFDNNSGQLDFLPDMVQRSLVVNKVTEYKNGVEIGSSMREMTFIVLDNCQNNAPKGDIDSASVSGGAANKNTINVCVNTPGILFSIPAYDADSNKVTVAINNLPAGATANVTGNGSGTTLINVSWNTENVPVGNYYMYITYTDDACPLYSSQTIAYTIKVVNPIAIKREIIQPTNCLFLEKEKFTITEGVSPFKITITGKGGVVRTYTDIESELADSLDPGEYTLTAESAYLKCKSSITFNVADSGTYPFPPIFDNVDVCINDEPEPFELTVVDGAEVKWYDAEGARLKTIPAYSTAIPTTHRWMVTQTVRVCESVPGMITATVHDLPDIEILNPGGHVCVGDGMYLLAKGGIKYEWQPAELVVKYNDSPFTYVNQPTSYSVTGYDAYGCANTDTVIYNDIEQCCKFSYPNAFTPNSDGHNDGWHPVTYGNVDFYLLSVYDRWGKRLFVSSDPRDRWDGTENGRRCEIGTYHYFLRARCVTGHEEQSKGSFILAR